MLFFIDESWQTTNDGKYKVGVLAAYQIKSHDFNGCSQKVFDLKVQHFGYNSGITEIKGRRIFRDYLFKLEDRGIKSLELNLARSIFKYINSIGTKLFASIVFSKNEIELSCADVNQLERPFFFLFERIDLFMKENYPGLMAKLIFDDRDVQFNKKLSTSVSNFFHKSSVGQSFSNVIKVPFFAISDENIGIQIADMVAYILGSRFTGSLLTQEFFWQVKVMEFVSRKLVTRGGKEYPIKGFKVIKEKEAGELL